MKAFFDESGLDPSKDKALILGGFLAPVGEWERVSDLWDECLHESPSVEFFSSRKCSEEKTNRLAQVIAHSDLQGFCASVPHVYFANRDPRASRKVTGTRIYDWGFLTATSGILQYMKRVHPSEKVDFVFDRRNELNACIGTYNEMKSCGWPDLMKWAGECIPGDDKELMPLQMADLLAGEFLALANGNGPSEAWKIIAGAHPVAHLKGYLPVASQRILESQKLGRKIEDTVADILRRFYKNNERSVEMVVEFAELLADKAFFDTHFSELVAMF
jgi:hypothetical protein